MGVARNTIGCGLLTGVAYYFIDQGNAHRVHVRVTCVFLNGSDKNTPGYVCYLMGVACWWEWLINLLIEEMYY